MPGDVHPIRKQKPKVQRCPVCREWIPHGSIGPRGCPFCKGAKT